MTLNEPSSPRIKAGPLWLLMLCLAVSALNVYLLLSLSPWWNVAVALETGMTLGLIVTGFSMAITAKKPPKILQILLCGSLAAVWILNPLRDCVVDYKVEQAGTERLLLDARALAEKAGASAEHPLTLDSEDARVPASFQIFHPLLVRVRPYSVELVKDEGISWTECLLIDTDPHIVAGPVKRGQKTSNHETDWSTFRRPIAPGIEWYSATT